MCWQQELRWKSVEMHDLVFPDERREMLYPVFGCEQANILERRLCPDVHIKSVIEFKETDKKPKASLA